MTIRTLGVADAEAMAAIHAASFDKPWSALDMSVHLGRDLCLGSGSPLASFVILRRSDVDAEILTVATRPGKRGKGRAGELISQAACRLAGDGLRTVFLEVAEDNDSARALYDRLGFEAIGRRPGYYRRANGRMAALTYALRLDGTPPAR